LFRKNRENRSATADDVSYSSEYLAQPKVLSPNSDVRRTTNSPESQDNTQQNQNYRRNFASNVVFDSQLDVHYTFSLSESNISSDSSAMSINIAKLGEYKDIGIQAGSPLYESVMAEPLVSSESKLSTITIRSHRQTPPKQDIVPDAVHYGKKTVLRPLKKVPTREKNEKVLKPMTVQSFNKLPPVDKAFLLKLERENVVEREQPLDPKTALEKSHTLFHMNINKKELGCVEKKKCETNPANKLTKRNENEDDQVSQEDLILKEVENLLRESTLPIYEKTKTKAAKEKSDNVNNSNEKLRVAEPTSQKTVIIAKVEPFYNPDELDLIDSIEKEFNVT